MGQKQHRRQPFVVGQRRAADPGAGRAGVEKQVDIAVGRHRHIVIGVVRAVVDEEVFARRQERQADAAASLGDVEVHDRLGTGGAQGIHDLRHRPHLLRRRSSRRVPPRNCPARRGRAGVVAAVLADGVPLEVGDADLPDQPDQLVGEGVAVAADQAQALAGLGFPDLVRLGGLPRQDITQSSWSRRIRWRRRRRSG